MGASPNQGAADIVYGASAAKTYEDHHRPSSAMMNWEYRRELSNAAHFPGFPPAPNFPEYPPGAFVMSSSAGFGGFGQWPQQ